MSSLMAISHAYISEKVDRYMILSIEIKENKNSISFFDYSVASGNINSKTYVRRELTCERYYSRSVFN